VSNQLQLTIYIISIERKRFAVIEEYCNEITLKNNILRVSSITTDATTKTVHITLTYWNRTGDKTFISSKILSLRLCECGTCLKHFYLQNSSIKTTTSREFGRRDWPRTVVTNIIIFGEIRRADCTVDG
jgi:hypothetical protein